MKNGLLVLVTAGFYTLGVALVSANPLGKLNSVQRTALKELGIKIAIPTYIPDGFNVAMINTKPCPASGTGVLKQNSNGVCRFGPEYSVLYKNSANNCFAIVGIGGGIGGIGNEFTYKTDTRLFGKVNIVFGKQGGEISDGKYMQIANAAQLKSPQSNLSSEWAGSSPFYAINVIDEGGSKCAKNSTISPVVIEKILKSLTWLK